MKLANDFWPKNLVIVTHGYGVSQAVAMGGEWKKGFGGYCAFAELTRTSRDSSKWTAG